MNVIQEPVTIETNTFETPKNYMDLNVYYPQVSNLDDLDRLKKINNRILVFVNKLISQQVDFSKENTHIRGHYEVKTNQRGILSLSFINFTKQNEESGHIILGALTYNSDTGRELALEAIFRQNSPYQERLNAIIHDKIKDRNLRLIKPFKGILKDQGFYIADKSLVLFYQPGDYTTVEQGILYFSISLYSLRDLLYENNFIHRLIEM